MSISRRAAGALLAAGLSAISGLGQTYELTSASAQKNTIHIFPSSTGQVTSGVNTSSTGLNMVQGNGLVMRNPANYLIFWQPPGRAPFPAGYQSGIEKFFQNLGGTPFYNIVTQYNDKSGDPIPPNSTYWGGSWLDTATVPPSGCNGSAGAVGTTPNCPLTDADIQNEVTRAIAARPGWIPGINAEYFVFTPSDVVECAGADRDGHASCFAINGGPGPNGNGDYCAYHTYFGDKIYIYQPFTGNGNCTTQNVFPNGRNLDTALSAVSHEMFESNTDPLLNGWKGPGGNDDEIGDKCTYKYGFLAPDGTNLVLNGNRYQIQTEWSNSVSACTKRLGPASSLSMPSLINFGSVAAGIASVRTLDITNSGTGDANILNVRTGAGSDIAFSLTGVPAAATLYASNRLSVNIAFTGAASSPNPIAKVVVDSDQTTCDSGDSCSTSTSELVSNLAATVVIPPVIGKAFAAASIPLGSTVSLTFTIVNPNAIALTGVGFTDLLPSGLTLGNVTGGCGGGAVTGTAGSGTISLTGATLPPGTSCSFGAALTATSPGVRNNVTSNVISNEAGVGNQAIDTLLVIGPPFISENFAPAKVPPGGSSTATFRITNPNSFAALTGVSLNQTLPAGLVVATPGGLTSSCGGVFSAAAGSVTGNLAGGTIAAGGSCNITLGVTATGEGNYLTQVQVTSVNGGTGNTTGTTLLVAASPVLNAAFGAVSMGPFSTTSLRFTLTNPNHVVPLTTVLFSDTLPGGLVVANSSELTGNCASALTATAGSHNIAVTGVSLPPQANCVFGVNVSGDGSVQGYLTNATGATSSVEALPGAGAMATLFLGDPFQVSYSANLGAGDSVVNITNPGTMGSGLASGTNAATTGAICANVYAFTPDEQMVSCCSCPVTPNGLVSLSVNNDLVSNTLTPASPSSIVIKLLATLPAGGNCTNSAAAAGTAALASGMIAFGTTLHGTPQQGSYALTETPFAKAVLSSGELSRLSQLCNFIVADGSGYGICRSCRLGGLGATRQ